MKKKEKYNSVKHVFKLITNILSWTVFVLLLIVAGFLVYYLFATKIYAQKGDNYKPAFGLYTIISPSMEPNLNIYDVIVNVNVKNPDNIKVGDVITFISTASISKGMTITHRVISISDGPNGKLYQTKGDNNLSPDSVPAPYENVLGKVVIKIPQLGRLQSFLATRGGWLVVVVIPAVVIILSDILKLFRLNGVQKQAKSITVLDEQKKLQNARRKEEIKNKLHKKLKPQRKANEQDPLRKEYVVVKVPKSKKETVVKDLPKLKKTTEVPKKKRGRRKKKKE